MIIGDDVLDNVLTFEYLGSRLQCDGDDQVDVRHRMDIAQAAFGSLGHLWTDYRLSRETKLRQYKLSRGQGEIKMMPRERYTQMTVG